jgi:hypothetical protein
MARLFRLVVDTDALTDEMFAFITDPKADSRNHRDVLAELQEFLPDAVYVLESMCVDGVDERGYVADYVDATISPRVDPGTEVAALG